jgi:RND family efflux transporter MFP subunit
VFLQTDEANIVTILRSTRNILSKQKFLASAAIGVVVLGVIAIVVIGRSGQPAQAAPTAVEVEVVQVKQDNVPIYREWVATTDGMVNAEIKAQVSGYLLKQDYSEGSLVKKGQLLFEIDPRPFQAALAQANGELAQFQGQFEQAVSQVTQAEAQLAQANSQVQQAQAQLSLAQANQGKTQLDVNKYAPLAEQKAVTQQDYDNAIQANKASAAQVEAAKAGVEAARSQLRVAAAQVGTARAAVATAKGQVENAKASVKTAELNLGFTRIISPIDGIAGIAQAQVGNLISSTSGALTTVSTVDPIKVYFTLNEQEYLDFTKRNLIDAQPGASVAQLELELILSDGTTFPHQGSFLFADRQVDPKTGAIRLAGVFLNPGNVLRPGQFGRVRAVTSTRDDALLVPQRAVSELQGSYQVAVVGDDNKVSIRPVKVGERVDQMWIINEGLKAGERVVVEGTQKVRPGVVVNPVSR